MAKPKIIAYYLPQFHPVPENDLWWGKGFTEWTNVGKAQPLFKGHYQPRVPADLGYYDLRVAETRQAQADLASQYGIYGFCYWHYWFNGKQLLERPFNEVLSTGSPDYPFCLAWANESWKGFDHGLKRRNTLIEQTYGGVEDHTAHFHAILPALLDHRYIRHDGRPVFLIYFPDRIPDICSFVELWQSLAKKSGLSGIFFVGLSLRTNQNTLAEMQHIGMDAITTVRLEDFYDHMPTKRSFLKRLQRKLQNERIPSRVYDYSDAAKYFYNILDSNPRIYPTIISGWDHSPRTGRDGLILDNYTPDAFSQHVSEILSLTEKKTSEDAIVFLKSWNEWAEGNYMEPDLRYGHQFLEMLKQRLDCYK